MRKLIPMLLTAILTFVVTAVRAAEEPKDAAALMELMSAKMKACQNWSGDFKQSMSMMGANMAFTGRMTAKPPKQLRMEMTMPMMGQEVKMLMVMGEDLWMWQQMDMAGQKQIIKMNMAVVMSNALAQSGLKMDPLQSMDPSRQWEMSKEFLSYKLLPAAEVAGEPVWILEGTWKESAASNKLFAAQAAMFGKSRVYVGKKDGFTRKLEQYDKAGENVVMTMEFSNLKLNQDLRAGTFEYQPPAGANVMDMTEMAQRGMAGGMGMGGMGGPPPPADK
jgi:outer membrane lipoprotein-sorting protein